jgi:Pvc16 N-terminal domain
MGRPDRPEKLSGGTLPSEQPGSSLLLMIQDVDDALRTLVLREALNGAGVEVAFDAPTRDWSTRRNAPTVDLYLYDIREDLQRREVAWQPVRDRAGLVTDRRPPPRHYRLSYLVTAWTQRPEDEHRLLSALLACFIRHERLPDDVLAGSLADRERPVFATIALPPPTDRSLSDVWSALGGELKPSLDLVVIAPLTDARKEAVGPPVLEEPRLTGAVAAGGRARSRRPRPEAAGRPEAPLPDETRRSGSEAKPGRTVRVRAKR